MEVVRATVQQRSEDGTLRVLPIFDLTKGIGPNKIGSEIEWMEKCLGVMSMKTISK
jgi:hypothetical protein